jgi:hypothetical protein
MPITITLVQDLDTRPPAALQLEYALNGEAKRPTWDLTPTGGPPTGLHFQCNAAPAHQAALVPPGIPATHGLDPVPVANVQSKTLIVHYPTAPNTVRIQVSSVHA